MPVLAHLLQAGLKDTKRHTLVSMNHIRNIQWFHSEFMSSSNIENDGNIDENDKNVGENDGKNDGDQV